MEFKKYKKIFALHKEECEGLLEGLCYIQEKIDGANTSIWLGDDGEIHYGSRSRNLFLQKDSFNGFADWIENNKEKLINLFKEHPTLRLNGEWLVRHTIKYNELAYRKFYVFDMEKNDVWADELVPFEEMYLIAEKFNIPTVEMFATVENPTLEIIQEFSGKSSIGERGEGVVIKNPTFINKFGERQFGKFVTQEFKETNALVFGGNNKHSDTYWEVYFMNKFMTLPRVQKVFHKMESEHGRLDMKHIPLVMGVCYHDLITEDGWEIAKIMGTKNDLFNFKKFKSLCDNKSKMIFIELLHNDLSVAHQNI